MDKSARPFGTQIIATPDKAGAVLLPGVCAARISYLRALPHPHPHPAPRSTAACQVAQDQPPQMPHLLNFIEFHYFTKVGNIWGDYSLLLVKCSGQAIGDIVTELDFLKRRNGEADRDLQLNNANRALKLTIK